ncbi:MAG: hypothetical protein H6715_00295 [Myxococcales bacterium]|nr:hypothetical protein [Myxococcales bacterium]MCB9707404.1 hypothetical protein [Myxococcales bacterium]
MSSNEEDLDTDIDHQPLDSTPGGNVTSSPEARTKIDEDLAERVLKAFPEMRAGKTSKAEQHTRNSVQLERQSDKPRAGGLPRTVLQAPLQPPTHHETPERPFAVPPSSGPSLSGVRKAVSVGRSALLKLPVSTRVLLGAVVFAVAVFAGWQFRDRPPKVTADAPPLSAHAPSRVAASVAAEAPSNPSSTSPSPVPLGAPARPLAPEPPLTGTPDETGSSVATPSEDPETAAARVLVSGQRVEALNLYQRLAAQFPKKTAFAIISRALERPTPETCPDGAAPGENGCLKK